MQVKKFGMLVGNVATALRQDASQFPPLGNSGIINFGHKDVI